MSKFIKLVTAVYAAKDKLDKAEAARDAFMEPILTVLGATGGGISSVQLSDHCEHIYIERSGSTRGCAWSDEYRFPTRIFTAANPLAEATIFVADQKLNKDKAERERKLAELARLKAELGETSK